MFKFLFLDGSIEEPADNPLGLNPAVTIFLTILVLVVMAGLIFLLFRGIRKERKKIELQQTRDESGVAESDFMEIIKQKCRKENATFSVWELMVPDRQNMLEIYGQSQYGRAFNELQNRLKKIFPSSTRFSVTAAGELLLLVSSKQTDENLKSLAATIIYECNNGMRLSESLTIPFDVNIAVVQHNESNKTAEQIDENLKYSIAQSQRIGLNQFYFHAPDISDTDSEEYKTYVEIKSAIENKEFMLYYQPINDLVTGDVAGYESLLRWNHRTMGVLPPSTFLNIIDTSGDINWVGVWAFEQLLSQHAMWAKFFPERKFFLSMNLSAKQLMSEKLVAEMRHVLKKYKTFVGDICMEIAEFAFLQTGIIADNIEKLSQAGFMIAVDNYGMAMNITALDKFKIDFIKIERQFINKALGDTNEQETSKEMLKLIISYANRRKIKLVAEGIEDADMMAAIRELGLRYGQGYHFGKPAGPDEIKMGE